MVIEDALFFLCLSVFLLFGLAVCASLAASGFVCIAGYSSAIKRVIAASGQRMFSDEDDDSIVIDSRWKAAADAAPIQPLRQCLSIVFH